MIHPDEDQLLKSVLEVLAADEEEQLQGHLQSCEECRPRYQRLSGELEMMGSIDPAVAITMYPLPRRPRPRAVAWLKVAALIAVGFGTGYVVNSFLQGDLIHVVPHYPDVRVTELQVTSLTPCASVDTAVDLTWLDEVLEP